MKIINSFIVRVLLVFLMIISFLGLPARASASDATFDIFKALNQEVGENDFRISITGEDGNPDFSANRAHVVYNPSNNEYFVVWYGGLKTGIEERLEVYGQRLDAETGDKIGDQIQISDMGIDENDSAFDAYRPAVAYNSADNEYLVVWNGNTDALVELADSEKEVFGQRIGSDGSLLGDEFRISNAGPDGDDTYSVSDVDVAYNSQGNEYLVVWHGRDDPLGASESEIFGQLLNADGGEIGDDFRISEMGTDGVFEFSAREAAVAYNSQDNQYLVVWWGWDDAADLNPEVEEIFIEILNADGSVVVDDRRISIAGPLDDNDYYVTDPAIDYNSRDNQYLIAWEGSDDSAYEVEIFGQVVDADGTEIGDDFRISDMGSSQTSEDFGAYYPSVTYNPNYNEYLVGWSGNDDTDPLLDNNEVEVYIRRFASDGSAITDAIRISDMGGFGDTLYMGTRQSSAHNSQNDEYLIVWDGSDTLPGLNPDEYEIYGQRFVGPSCGDGELESEGEECDDGNTEDGDGCSGKCIAEVADGGKSDGGGCTLVKDASSGKGSAVVFTIFVALLFVFRLLVRSPYFSKLI